MRWMENSGCTINRYLKLCRTPLLVLPHTTRNSLAVMSMAVAWRGHHVGPRLDSTSDLSSGHDWARCSTGTPNMIVRDRNTRCTVPMPGEAKAHWRRSKLWMEIMGKRGLWWNEERGNGNGWLWWQGLCEPSWRVYIICRTDKSGH